MIADASPFKTKIKLVLKKYYCYRKTDHLYNLLTKEHTHKSTYQITNYKLLLDNETVKRSAL